MSKKRLSEPFLGFDSIDERMKRIPNDLNDEKLRKEYIENHKNWFLKNHNLEIEEFEKLYLEKYKDNNLKNKNHLKLFSE